LRNAREEIEFGTKDGNFDAVIVNSDLDRAYCDLKTLIFRLYRRISVSAA
jgi:guanylate kinase